MKYEVTKLLDGYTICFRQWNAKHSHCKFLHGYAISFKLYFKADGLDENNWVWDFGWLKNKDFKIDGMPAKEWFSYMFDHTVLISEDDPALDKFEKLDKDGIIKLRIIPKQSCEKMSEFIFNKVNKLVKEITQGRVKLHRVDTFEHNKNCASFIGGSS